MWYISNIIYEVQYITIVIYEVLADRDMKLQHGTIARGYCTSASLIHTQVIVQPMFRNEVLSLYRRIFRLARQWQATIAADTEEERQYIRDEARKLFHKNKKVSLYFFFFTYCN